MPITENFVERKLKIRIGPKGVSREYCSDVITHAAVDSRDNISVEGNKRLDEKNNLKLSYQDQSKKRGLVTILENQMAKRMKIDREVKKQCADMLNDLRNHRSGWAFRDPVDPVAFNIPDYFSIIKKPMDFRKIGSKLERNIYSTVDEFAADVRLTFSNCKLYNPPTNQFHVMARELSSYFETKWKFFEKILKSESKNALPRCTFNDNSEVTQGMIKMDHKTYPSKVGSVKRRAMSVEEKQKLVKDLKELLRGEMTEKLQSILQKYNLCSLKESIDLDIGSIDDEILWELKRTTNNLLKVKIEAAKVTQRSARPLSDKGIEKRINGASRVSCSSAKVKLPASSVNSKCGSCGSSTCRCGFSSNKVQSCKIFASGTVKRPGEEVVSRNDHYVENLATSCNGRLDPNTNGSVVEEAACMSPDSSICGSMAMSNEACTPAIDIHMSPKQALRAAKLKSRFADTIFRAKHKTLLEQGDKADPVNLRREKDKLEKQHREEKARIEAQIVAAEAAFRLRVQSELKMPREREREAARIALEQMERTVDIDDNLKFLRDLELMSRSPGSDCRLAGSPGSPLKRLGLYFKEDYIEEDDDFEKGLVNSEDGSEDGEIME